MIYNFRFICHLQSSTTKRWDRINAAYRPSTEAVHSLHFRTFVAFLIFMGLPVTIPVQNALLLWSIYIRMHCLHESSQHTFPPSRLGPSFHTLYRISVFCDILSDPMLYRAIFMTAFFRMSNIALTVPENLTIITIFYDNIIFAPPGAHLLIKWTKTLQHHKAHHWIQLPTIQHNLLCPVRALRSLLQSRPQPQSAPLFANIFKPHSQVIDTHVRDALKRILVHNNIPLRGYGFQAIWSHPSF